MWEIPAGQLSEDNIRSTLTDFGLDGRVQKVTGATDVFRVRRRPLTPVSRSM